MKSSLSLSPARGIFRLATAPRTALARSVGVLAMVLMGALSHAQTLLADRPLATATPVTGNLALALSVEFPTAVSVAHLNAYTSGREYLGYFDPDKCYLYRASVTDSTTAPNTTAPDSYFYPDGAASSATPRTCSGKWSGNFLNWATMQTIDPFRWALTGGTRVIDTDTLTVLEKAWASGQGGTGNFPNREITDTTTLTGATPLTGLSRVRTRIQGLGNKLRFSSSSSRLDDGTTPIHYDNSTGTTGTVYEVFVRVKVCDSAVSAGGLETNCSAYGANHKPEGLIQQYSDRIRYSAFGYLNDGSHLRDGGVLRARQKYVAPLQPVPGSLPAVNAAREWDATTGVFLTNPDSADAATTATIFDTPVANSGVINYLNKFGASGSYKTYDPVSELYYAAVRYFKNLGNVAQWTNVPTGTGPGFRAQWVDNFPVITTWDDPIIYSCQRNFILGIGDANTHADKNVPGTGTPTANEPTKPTFGDPVNAVTATNRIGLLEGIGGGSLGTVNPYNGCCTNNSTLMAGIAYDSHTRDIRPDVNTQRNTLGMQTISTYWLDVMEYQTMKSNNQFLLAAKYGGFEVPLGFNPYTNTVPLPQTWWSTTTDTLPDGARRPNNYFTAGEPRQMIDGLNAAFLDMAARIRAYTTSFSTTLPQVAQTGNGSYSTLYDSRFWTGEVTAKVLSFDVTTGDPILSADASWVFSTELAAQAATTGWSTNRRIATWDPVSRTARAFRATGTASITAAQLSALNPDYTTSTDGADYLNYLRGDRTNEVGSTATGSTNAYRTRTSLLGDIEGSKALPIGPPAFPFSDSYNPGYTGFKGAWNNRRTVVYVGSNNGMLHAINGALQRTNATPGLEIDTNAGREMFAYVPSALFNGPSTPATPSTDGLAALGQTPYVHKYFVNSTPMVFDIDFWRTPNPLATTTSPDWRSVLVGGLGKGGKSYYAIDVTDPETMALNETNVVDKVLWEFSDTDMGFTYGEGIIAKTRKYGWVYVFPSGYNNPDGQGYFFFVNPRTGELLEKISTGEGTVAAPAGLAHLNGYVEDYTNGTMDAIYAGDLLGNLWRIDVTAATGAYPAPVKLAILTEGNTRQPVTSKPVIEVDPRTNRRWVMVGTGRMLATSDIGEIQNQTFYGITDGGHAFGTFAAAPTAPLSKADLAPVASTLAATTVDFTTQRGWYLNLGYATDASGNPALPVRPYRVTTRPTSYFGSVTFVANVVDITDACSPAGVSRVYSLDFSNALSLLRSSVTRDTIPFLSTDANVTDIKDLSVNGKREIIFGDDRGGLGQAISDPPAGASSKRLNWREIQTVN